MTITHYPEMVQGSTEWSQARLGLLTASEMKLIITPTLKVASNGNERAHLFELLAQRVTEYVEPRYVGDDMLRGIGEEIDARTAYAKHYAPVDEVGFITNDQWGFTLGYSPDGLVGSDGAIECKSRRQKFQVETIIAQTVPAEFMLQLQTGLLVAGRKWIDFVSYCGGLPMVTIRVEPDPVIQAAILEAAENFEARLAMALAAYRSADGRMIPTERKIADADDMFIGEG